jgi:hypothetical protein
MQHTPGPWGAEYEPEYGVWKVMSYDYFDVAETSPFRSGTEQAANARLLAAAPDLLTALEQFVVGSWSETVGCLCYDDECDPETCVYALGRTAIAKARGEGE